MRKVAAAVLAAPVLAAIYAPVVFRRRVAVRVGLTLAFGCLVLVTALGAFPRGTAAMPASTPAPVPQARFGPLVSAGLALNRPVTVDFNAPMDRASVTAALTVAPATKVQLAWEAGGARLVVQPAGAWLADTYYTVTIGATARDAAGHALGSPVRAGFLTRRATSSTIAATKLSGADASVQTAFTVTFDVPVDASSARAAFAITPTVTGQLTVDSESATRVLTFKPTAALAAGTAYTVRLSGPVTDAEGGTVATADALTVRTVTGPGVVRFRPLNGTAAVARSSVLSVRFTRAMSKAATAASFSVTAAGQRVVGKVSWAEGNTVLVFTPAAQLPAGAQVVMTVGPGATAATGAATATAVVGRFTTVAAPKPAAKVASRPVTAPRPVPKPTPIPKPATSAGSAAWAAVERYYVSLMNCTRGGGLVTSTGACSSPGGSGIKPLWIDSGISSKVSRPYAKLLATTGSCSHFSQGNPGTRLSRAGYPSYKWAENLGCRDASNPYASVLGTQLYFQSERTWSPLGGHWVNMMNPLYDRVGIGLWAANGHVRLVIDFYRP